MLRRAVGNKCSVLLKRNFNSRIHTDLNGFLVSKLMPRYSLSTCAISSKATIRDTIYKHDTHMNTFNNDIFTKVSFGGEISVQANNTSYASIPIIPNDFGSKRSLHTYISSNSISKTFIVTRRSMSTDNNKKIPIQTSAKVTEASGGEGFDGTMVAAVLVSTALAAYIISPENLEKMRSSTNEYNEVEVEDDIYNRIKDVSDEVRGEITRKILGKELAEMMEAEHKTAGNTADVVADVLNSDALQNAIASLITRVVSSDQFQSACQTLLKNLWSDLVNDPETLAQIVALLNTAIKDEKIKKSFKELVLGLLQDEEVYNELTGLVVKLGEDKEVLDATKELLTESAHQALNDPEILDHSMEFATDIVGDNVIQRTSGEALRNTVTYAVRPSLSTCEY